MKNLYKIQEDQSAVAELVEKTRKKSVLSIILWSAMMHLKSNPNCSLKEAIEAAKTEWDMPARKKD